MKEESLWLHKSQQHQLLRIRKMIAQIVKEVNKKPSEKSKIASQKLEAKFSSMSIKI